MNSRQKRIKKILRPRHYSHTMPSDDSILVTVADLKKHPSNQKLPFESIYLVRQIEERIARNGSDFLSVELGDKTGSFRVICFSDSANYLFFKDVSTGTAVKVQGHTDYYKDRFSPRLTFAEPLLEDELETPALLDHLVESSTEDLEALWEELNAFIAQIKHEKLRETVLSVMEEIGGKFRSTPAGIKMHHAYRGGLLEHTVHIARACAALLPLYPEVNPDLAMAGVILHDVGKTAEYTDDLATKRARKGILHGHVVLGYRLVRKAGIHAKLDPALLERLEHIILSHQGEMQWGATAPAATPEAVFVSQLDNLDSRMGMVQYALRTTPETQEFSEYSPGLQAPILTTPPATEPPDDLKDKK